MDAGLSSSSQAAHRPRSEAGDTQPQRQKESGGQLRAAPSPYLVQFIAVCSAEETQFRSTGMGQGSSSFVASSFVFWLSNVPIYIYPLSIYLSIYVSIYLSTYCCLSISIYLSTGEDKNDTARH